jgi:hypothetical protein
MAPLWMLIQGWYARIPMAEGFNFQLPDESKYRYTKDNPYIGKGSNREVKLGKEYTGFEADVAEFNDLYMKDVYSPDGVQKMGLGISLHGAA